MLVVGQHIGGPGRFARLAIFAAACAVGVGLGLAVLAVWSWVRL